MMNSDPAEVVLRYQNRSPDSQVGLTLVPLTNGVTFSLRNRAA
jgi:hypothetical protein